MNLLLLLCFEKNAEKGVLAWYIPICTSILRSTWYICCYKENKTDAGISVKHITF